MPGTGRVNWNHILFAVNIVIKCSADNCADDDVDIDDISCKYWVVTIRINLPKISLWAWPFQYIYSVNF